MSFDFDLDADPLNTVQVNEIELDGVDVYCRGGQMILNANGDLATVFGQGMATQSVERELPANPGDFPRRPDWGGGLSGMIHKGNTQSSRDRMQARARARCIANPLLVKVHEIVVSTDEEGRGTRCAVRADSLTGFVDTSFLVKPPGVS